MTSSQNAAGRGRTEAIPREHVPAVADYRCQPRDIPASTARLAQINGGNTASGYSWLGIEQPLARQRNQEHRDVMREQFLS
jgi:hypothetical protein